jgi:hypothetical protein
VHPEVLADAMGCQLLSESARLEFYYYVQVVRWQAKNSPDLIYAALFNANPTDMARSFERDLQILAENVLGPVGPSIQIEPVRKPDMKPNGLPVAMPVASCKPPLADYSCSWSKYLAANPAVSDWATANPRMAEKERLRLGGVE